MKHIFKQILIYTAVTAGIMLNKQSITREELPINMDEAIQFAIQKTQKDASKDKAMHSEDINIGIDKKDRHKVAKMLNILLADEYVLYTKTLNYHWNVYGRAFDQFHSFFKKQYEDLFKIIDTVAERVRSVGFRSLGTMSEFLKHTRLKEEQDDKTPQDINMVKKLLNDHESIITNLHSNIALCSKYGDHGTENLLGDLIERHEKMAWMLRSFIETSAPENPTYS
jgi:starvation-inducible DNA-binding protein